MKVAKGERLVSEFYELKVNQLMDKRVWDLYEARMKAVEKREENVKELEKRLLRQKDEM